MIAVLTTIGRQEYPKATLWKVEDDRLVLFASIGKPIAEFQHGVWLAVEDK